MKLSQITIKRYKAFSNEEVLQVRPLTVLIGRNNSGKSVIARLPVLLSHAFSEHATGPLERDAGGLDFGGSLIDFIHGRSIHGAIEFGLRVEDEHRWYDWRIKVQHFDEYKLQTIDRLEVVSSEGEHEILSRTTSDPRSSVQQYAAEDGKILPLTFNGFCPASQEGLPAVIERSKVAISTALSPTRYLGPFRAPPTRAYYYPTRAPRDVGPFGGSAAIVVGTDALRGEGRLLARVSEVFERTLGTGPVNVVHHGDTFSLVVRDRLTSAPISLVDTGVGLGQVLPLIVQRALDLESGLSGGIEVVEQPELHLHPQAHADIADLYIDALHSPDSPRFIVETHSENILLRIRRRIAEGRIRADQVSLYWVREAEVDQSRLLKIEIDRYGDVSTWPRGVFSEDFEEAKALARARSKIP